VSKENYRRPQEYNAMREKEKKKKTSPLPSIPPFYLQLWQGQQRKITDAVQA